MPLADRECGLPGVSTAGWGCEWAAARAPPSSPPATTRAGVRDGPIPPAANGTRCDAAAPDTVPDAAKKGGRKRSVTVVAVANPLERADPSAESSSDFDRFVVDDPPPPTAEETATATTLAGTPRQPLTAPILLAMVLLLSPLPLLLLWPLALLLAVPAVVVVAVVIVVVALGVVAESSPSAVRAPVLVFELLELVLEFSPLSSPTPAGTAGCAAAAAATPPCC